MKRVGDISGTYAAVGLGATVGGGASALKMRNANGVIVDVVASTEGIGFSIVTIILQDNSMPEMHRDSD